jgi:glutamine synthetase
LLRKLEDLESSVLDMKNYKDSLALAKFCREKIFINMQSLRGVADELEATSGKEYWPIPAYGELLYSV